MSDINTQNIERVFKVEALSVNLNPPFVLTSGRISLFYFNMGTFQNYPKEWAEAVKDYAYLVKETVGEVDRIAGGLVKDVVFSIPVAQQLGIPHTIIRKEKKQFGLGDRFVPPLREGEKVAIVSDLLTTGKSALSWIEAVREAKGIVTHQFNYFDRREGGIERIQQETANNPVPLSSVVQLDDHFFDVAHEKGYLSKEEFDHIQEFLQNPHQWALDHLRQHPEILEQHVGVENGQLTERRGVDMVTMIYPELKEELGPRLQDFLHQQGLKEAVPQLAEG